MRKIHAIALVMSLLLLAGGCAGSRRAGKTSLPAGPDGRQAPGDSAAVDTKDGPANPCLEGHGFAILNFRAVRDSYDQVSVVGEIKNIGPAARGVELQASLRGPGGRLVSVGHFFPASYGIIQPGETWPFTYSFGRQEGAVDAELRIVGAFQTIDILSVASTPQ